MYNGKVEFDLICDRLGYPNMKRYIFILAGQILFPIIKVSFEKVY